MRLIIFVFLLIGLFSFAQSTELELYRQQHTPQRNANSPFSCACICSNSTSSQFIGFADVNDCTQCENGCASNYPLYCNINNQNDVCLPLTYHSNLPPFPLFLTIVVSLSFVGVVAFFMKRVHRHRHEHQRDRSGCSRTIEMVAVGASLIVIIAAILFWVGTGNQKSMLDKITYTATGYDGFFDWIFVPMWLVPVFLCYNCINLIISVFNEVFNYSCFGRCCLVCFIPFFQVIFSIPLIVPFLLSAATSTVYSTGMCSSQNVGGFANLCEDFTYYSHIAMIGSGTIIFMSGFIFLISCIANCVIETPHHHHHQPVYQQVHVHYQENPNIPYQQQGNYPPYQQNNVPPPYTQQGNVQQMNNFPPPYNQNLKN